MSVGFRLEAGAWSEGGSGYVTMEVFEASWRRVNCVGDAAAQRVSTTVVRCGKRGYRGSWNPRAEVFGGWAPWAP